MNTQDMTPAQVIHAKMAGIPADRPGLLGEYPVMLYRSGSNASHHLLDEELKVAGIANMETMVANTVEEEADALSGGWTRSLDGSVPAAIVSLAEKDDEIALLRAQLAERDAQAPRGKLSVKEPVAAE